MSLLLKQMLYTCTCYFVKFLLPKDTKFVILIILMNPLINVGDHSKFCNPQALPVGPYKTINELWNFIIVSQVHKHFHIQYMYRYMYRTCTVHVRYMCMYLYSTCTVHIHTCICICSSRILCVCLCLLQWYHWHFLGYYNLNWLMVALPGIV